ncbi:MAG TPA: cation transporter [Solirubrobacteraceae bacterium]|nr:cation transporter [Solirubrobacteraceae bacterium]
MAKTTDAGATQRGVLASLAVGCVEALALTLAAWLTGSASLRSQVAAAAADVAVQVFLLIGVLSSTRPSDQDHPLGYGRERFFWSFLGALGIFIGGAGFALEGAIRSALHPAPLSHFTIAYLVLAVTVALDAVALEVQLRPLRGQARRRSISLRALLRRSTDPAATTVVLGGACGVTSGLVALAGLAASQAAGSPTPDTVASMLIGLLLLGASAFLLHTNRELLSGRGVPIWMLRDMRAIVAAQRGVVDVPDLFAVVVGPSSLIVNGDVTFDDAFDVPTVEAAIMNAAAELGERWPAIDYVYLTPVAHARSPRGGPWFRPMSSAQAGGSG